MKKLDLGLVLGIALAGSAALAACSGSETTPSSANAGSTDPTDPSSDVGADDGTDGTDGTSADAGTGSGSGTGMDGGKGSGATTSEFDVPAKCTNGMSSAGRGALMKPGEACGRCHDFGAAGTVYPTAHEPNDCKGANLAGAKIIVVDAANKTTTIAVNAAGNFISTASFKMPIKVSVSANGATRAMSTPLTAAMGTDCNACHTQNGAGSPKAPGRILAP